MIHFGRSDFVSDIDNEELDFEQLEAFIHNNSSVVQQQSTGSQQPSSTSSGTNNSNTNVNRLQNNQQSNLPESPPDSGSEPPYSPSNLQKGTISSVNRNHGLADIGDHQTMEHLSNLTELHVPHQLLGNSPELYINNNDHHQQQLLQLNNLLQVKHDASQEQTMIYQMAQNGHILEINQLQSQHQPPMNNRMYKHEILDMDQSGTIPALQDVQQQQQRNENLPIISENFVINNLIPEIPTSNANMQTQSKKRKSSHQEFFTDSIGNAASQDASLKPFIKTEENFQSNGKLIFSDGSVTSKNQKKKNLEINDDSKNEKKNFQHQTEIINKISIRENLHEGNEIKADSNSFMNGLLTKSTDTLNQDTSQIQCIRFSQFQQQQWHTLYDHNNQELALPHFRVDADKGFNFSNSDDAFVCQKKNHFQITCHVQVHGNPVYVKTTTGLEKIRNFHLHFYGIKLETPAQTIRIEQSQSDRSKKPFYPVPIELTNGQVSKMTVGRLHFSETTCNNMRKKGRPNPEQRYFQLVVGLHVHTYTSHYPVVSHVSERIIVRASNPGQFEIYVSTDSDIDLCCWQRGNTQNSIFHQGNIGINHDHPDESLVINGNLKLSGHIIQPSDKRIKNNIQELNALQQLENINKIRICKYQYDPTFAEYNEFSSSNFDTGFIAQEIQTILPDAVHCGGNVRLANGVQIDNFLQINKDRIFMENVGAVKQLTVITDDLEKRIKNLENWHNVKYRNIDRIKLLQFFMILLVFLTALWY